MPRRRRRVVFDRREDAATINNLAYSFSHRGGHDPHPQIEEFGEEAKSSLRTIIKTNPSAFAKTSRNDSSLPTITKRLVHFLQAAAEFNVEVRMKEAAEYLNYDARRLYDVINALEAMQFVERRDHVVHWIGTARFSEATALMYSEVKQLRKDERLIQSQIDQMKAEIRESSAEKDNMRHAYATFEDLAGCHEENESIVIVQCSNKSEIRVADRFLSIRSPSPFEAYIPAVVLDKKEDEERYSLGSLGNDVVENCQSLRSAE